MSKLSHFGYTFTRTSLVSCLAAMAWPALANQVLDNETRTLPDGTPADSYTLLNGSVLTVNSGSILSAGVNNSTLNLNNAASGRVTAINSQVNINDAQLTGDGLFQQALNLSASNALINGSTLTNQGAAGAALAVTTSLDGTVSNARLVDSTVLGADEGIYVTDRSTLELINTSVDTRDDNGVGLTLEAASATASGGRIAGGLHGVSFGTGRGDANDSQLTLDGTAVVGRSGAAIKVGNGTEATINIFNGTTLSGGDGRMLDIGEASQANVNVANAALKGDISVTGNSVATLDFNGAAMEGDIRNEAGSSTQLTLRNQANLIGSLDNVSSVTIDSAHWQMTTDSSVKDLALANGVVTLGNAGEFYKLSLENLSGNGRFVTSADFSAGATSFLTISGRATGNHELLVRSTGADPLADTSLHVVHANAGDAHFSLVGGTADLGAWSYELVQSPNGKDWYLDAKTRTVGPGTRAAMALFNTAPTVWYGELASLRSRMGELRYGEGRNAGIWMRSYGSKYNVADASGVGYSQNQHGLSFGADAPLPVGDGQWLVGLLAGHSRSDLDLTRGTSGSIDSYYAGAYATWLDAGSGYYFDALLKYNRYQNKAKVAFSDGQRAKGDYDNHGLGSTVEFGRHIKLDQGYFLEPYAQLSAVFIQDESYTLSNGLRAEGDQTRSFLGKLGAAAGRRFELDNGRSVQPYVKAAYAHEFANNNKARVNDNVFNNDLSGSRAELGVGVAVQLSHSFQLHADFDYSNGEHIEQPYGLNLGARYFW